MTRVQLAYKREDLSTPVNEAKSNEADALFEHMKTFAGKPEIPGTAGAFAIVARDPKLALLLINVSDYMTKEFPWTTNRRDLRQLMIQALNLHFRCDFNFQSHLSTAARDGISVELQAAIPYWKTSSIFNEEQRLVIEFTLAACVNDVSDELFEKVKTCFGDQGAVEMTVAVAWWGMWAIIAGVIPPEHDFGYKTPLAEG